MRLARQVPVSYRGIERNGFAIKNQFPARR